MGRVSTTGAPVTVLRRESVDGPLGEYSGRYAALCSPGELIGVTKAGEPRRSGGIVGCLVDEGDP